MNVETVELIIKLVFPICAIIMVRGIVNMKFINSSKESGHEDVMIAVGLMFIGFITLAFVYYPMCFSETKMNVSAFLVFLGFYSTGRLLYARF